MSCGAELDTTAVDGVSKGGSPLASKSSGGALKPAKDEKKYVSPIIIPFTGREKTTPQRPNAFLVKNFIVLQAINAKLGCTRAKCWTICP